MLPHIHSDAEACVEAVLSQVGRKVVLAMPIAIGKPNHFVNALYRRAVQDKSISLKIFTALSFVKPTLKSDLERRFAGPLVQRIFGNFPDLEYAVALRRGQLPPNIEVHDFFFQAGAFLKSPLAQQGYTSVNYTHATKLVLTLGVNVFGQLIAKRGEGDKATYSLASNTDLSLEVFPAMLERRKSHPFAIVGQVNSAMPYMTGEAEMPGSAFDHILEGPAFEFPLFAPPKEAVSLQDYAAAIHTAALIEDGGTIQLGIGTFSDALAHALVLRQTQNAKFRELANAIGAGRLHPRLPVETAPFKKGLYGGTEMLVDGYLWLYRAGILKRRVFDDLDTQRRADAGELSPEEYDRGALIHAGFFAGCNRFYESLRNLTEEERHAFRMTRIGYTNQLYGGEELKRAQRLRARFINSAMMVTLLGAAVSDALDDGRVVSGVGGQYNFVAQAHELDDGRSILELHAWRLENGRARTNVRWNYGHTTIPRHLRDIYVTEYGAADVRGLSDRDTIAAMLNIADSRFQDELLKEAKAAGKIEKNYAIPRAFQHNRPEWIDKTLGIARIEGILPEYPFGTDLTDEEIALIPAMTVLKNAQSSPLELVRLAARGKPWSSPSAQEGILLRRLGLETPKSAKERFTAALVLGALRST
jgi:acyl-CoA hydrolase